jgi:hypothetical protein
MLTNRMSAAPATRSTVLIVVFRDPAQAQEAVRALKQAGFRDEQIGVLARAAKGDQLSVDRATDSKVAEGSAVGAAAGAATGGLWALGIAAGILPALGPVVAGGLLASILASAGGGAAVGTLVGALVGLGIPEDDAAYYENEFKSGGTLLTVQVDGRAAEAWAILKRCGANRRPPEETYHRAATATGAAAVPTPGAR